MKYDLKGRFLGEEKIPYQGPYLFLGIIDGKLYGIRDEIRFSKFLHMEGFFETPYALYEISLDFKKRKRIYDIPIKHYIKKKHWWRRTMYAFVPFEHFLFVLHTPEYRISKLDLRKGKIVRIFSRPYKRKKIQQKEIEQDVYEPVPKRLLPPPFKYSFDIYAIKLFRNSLWVFTSTTKEKLKKVLVNVFNTDGKYIDYFYLEYPLSMSDRNYLTFNSLISDDGFIFIPEENKDTGLISIGKYRIENYNP